jgi:hypothetical protein
MTNPFDQVNQAMRDRDDKFTKREFAAMHILAGIMSNAQLPEKVNSIELAQLAIKSADILIQELGKPRK